MLWSYAIPNGDFLLIYDFYLSSIFIIIIIQSIYLKTNKACKHYSNSLNSFMRFIGESLG